MPAEITQDQFKSKQIFDQLEALLDNEGESLVGKVKGVYLFKVKAGAGGVEGTWIVDAKNGSGSVEFNGSGDYPEDGDLSSNQCFLIY